MEYFRQDLGRESIDHGRDVFLGKKYQFKFLHDNLIAALAEMLRRTCMNNGDDGAYTTLASRDGVENCS